MQRRQEKLSRRRNNSRAESQSLLIGRIYDDRGNRMSRCRGGRLVRLRNAPAERLASARFVGLILAS
jgi:hypothetical protein